MRADYGSHTERDAGLFAAAHAEPDDGPSASDLAGNAELDEWWRKHYGGSR